jgi:pantothenate kinase
VPRDRAAAGRSGPEGRLTGPSAVDPPLEELVGRARALADRGRTLLGLTGAPGAGKSTLAAALVEALGDRAVLVPMDGFHLDDAVLAASGGRTARGARHLRRRRLRPPAAPPARADDDVVYAPVFRRDQEQAVAGRCRAPATSRSS